MIRDHQRAIRAEAHVREVADWDSEARRKAYGAICLKLPILVHQAGIAPALHHVAQLSKPEKREILDHLASQLGDAKLLPAPGTSAALLAKVIEANTPRLLELTREVQRCLEWYGRFAKTILKAEAGEEVQ